MDYDAARWKRISSLRQAMASKDLGRIFRDAAVREWRALRHELTGQAHATFEVIKAMASDGVDQVTVTSLAQKVGARDFQNFKRRVFNTPEFLKALSEIGASVTTIGARGARGLDLTGVRSAMGVKSSYKAL